MINWDDFLGILIKLLENSIIKRLISDLYNSLGNKIKQAKITKELNDAINQNQVNDFIKKYQIPSEKASQILNVARIRKKVKTIERIIENKFFNEKSIDIISKLVNEFQELQPLSNFNEAKIQFAFKDLETGETIKTNNENYIFAVFKRFIASVYSHIAWKGLGEKGVALNFDIKVDALFSKFRDDHFSKLTLSEAISNLYVIYNEWKKIYNIYFKAIENLIESRKFIQKLSDNFSIYRYMNPDHLFGLAKGLQAEIQYWFYNFSEKISLYIELIELKTKNDNKLLSKAIMSTISEEDERTEFLKYIEYYSYAEEGLSGVKALLETSLELMIPGKEKDKFQKRNEEIKPTKAKPLLFVTI